MNRADAAQVMAVLSAPHGFTVEPDSLEVWYQAALERCDPELGIEVAVRLVETVEKFPTPAAFNNTATAITRERYETARIAKAQEEGRLLPPGVAAPDAARQAIANLRASFAATGTRGHDHRGPAACPVCSGINPDVLARLPQQERDTILAVQAQRRARRHADMGGLA